MKNIVFAALMLFGVSLPTNAGTEVVGDSISVLLWLEFRENNRGEVDNNDAMVIYSLNQDVSGRLYSNGQMELDFDCNEPVAVSIILNGKEVCSTEFVHVERNRVLVFNLSDYGNGAYEVNVYTLDGSVQTAVFDFIGSLY